MGSGTECQFLRIFLLTFCAYAQQLESLQAKDQITLPVEPNIDTCKYLLQISEAENRGQDQTFIFCALVINNL